MNILCIGDVVGSAGCDMLARKLPVLKRLYAADAVIVNGENSADGNGISSASAQSIFDAGADVSSAFYLAGRVSAVFGTHTHVQTADAQVLAGGTGFITDLGMTGPFVSVLGVKPELAIRKMKDKIPVRFANADGECVLEGCFFTVGRDGKCTDAQAVRVF